MSYEIMSYADTDRHSPYREEGEFHAAERNFLRVMN